MANEIDRRTALKRAIQASILFSSPALCVKSALAQDGTDAILFPLADGGGIVAEAVGSDVQYNWVSVLPGTAPDEPQPFSFDSEIGKMIVAAPKEETPGVDCTIAKCAPGIYNLKGGGRLVVDDGSLDFSTLPPDVTNGWIDIDFTLHVKGGTGDAVADSFDDFITDRPMSDRFQAFTDEHVTTIINSGNFSPETQMQLMEIYRSN